MAIEEPSYSVMATEGNFELRKYSSYIVAETYVEGDFGAIGSEGFRRLADYIGGKNKKKESISMTAPVSQKPASEKIAMTAPVSQARKNGRWRIAFMMPSAYTMETLPTPDDNRIVLREEKEKTVAVIRYSGTWGKNDMRTMQPNSWTGYPQRAGKLSVLRYGRDIIHPLCHGL